MDGVREHNFLVGKLVKDSRESHADLAIAFLDLTNAFGSISHQAIQEAVRCSGAGAAFVDIVSDMYAGSSTQLTTAGGLSEDIPYRAGVRQGCPLSALVFNLTIDTALRRALALSDAPIPGGAYADDIWLAAREPRTLQRMINMLADCGSGIGLQINADKSDTMQLVRGTASTRRQFTVNDTPIRRLSGIDTTRFLGKPVGHNVVPDENFVRDILREMELVRGANLAPWQKIDALQQFIIPRLPFPMSLDLVNKKTARTIDQHVRAFARETLNLPQNSSVHYLYTARTTRASASRR